MRDGLDHPFPIRPVRTMTAYTRRFGYGEGLMHSDDLGIGHLVAVLTELGSGFDQKIPFGGCVRLVALQAVSRFERHVLHFVGSFHNLLVTGPTQVGRFFRQEAFLGRRMWIVTLQALTLLHRAVGSLGRECHFLVGMTDVAEVGPFEPEQLGEASGMRAVAELALPLTDRLVDVRLVELRFQLLVTRVAQVRTARLGDLTPCAPGKRDAGEGKESHHDEHGWRMAYDVWEKADGSLQQGASG
jgi:hypothetical protein